MKHRNETRAIANRALVDHGQQPVLGHPRDLVRLVEVRRWTDLVGTPSDKDVVLAVSDADCGLEGERLRDLADRPSRFLLELASSCLDRLLGWLNNPNRHLPAPAVIHEAVSAQHQHPILIIEDEHHRDSLHPQHVVLETDAPWRLDVDQFQIDPVTLVQRPRTEDLPAGPSRSLSECSHGATLPRPRRCCPGVRGAATTNNTPLTTTCAARARRRALVRFQERV